ncbi:peptide chain release factor 2 [bacterium]|nr:MAG: peptide chain release factor 2 [bacterium]
MLIDDLREKLKSVEPDVQAIRHFWEQSQSGPRLAALTQEVNGANFWQHKDRDAISSEYNRLKHLAESYNDVTKTYDDNLEMIELFAENEQELAALEPEINPLCRKIKKFKLELFLNQEGDDKYCYMSINAGAGGTESQDWASMLLRMYLRFCEREGFNVDIIDYQAGEEAGIKSATLYVQKKNATGFLRTENGIHRLVRISPFDSNKRRHTSFAAVSITAEVEDVKIEINEDDLRIDTYRAGGAGGQHVNKTDSAVRITHLPTNIVVQCQNERSQARNKQTAMKLLKARLFERQEDERKAKEGAIKKQKIEWGSQIRSYVLHPYKMVKDHRTDIESPQPDLVLDGDLMMFIEAALLLDAAAASTQSK